MMKIIYFWNRPIIKATPSQIHMIENDENGILGEGAASATLPRNALNCRTEVTCKV